jgi:hypothetical protein
MKNKKLSQEIVDRVADKVDKTFDILNNMMEKLDKEKLDTLLNKDMSEIEKNDCATIILLSMLRDISVCTKRDIVNSTGFNRIYKSFDKSVLEKNYTYIKLESAKQLSLNDNYSTFEALDPYDNDTYPF